MFWKRWRFNLRFREDEPDFVDAESLPRKKPAAFKDEARQNNSTAAAAKKNKQEKPKERKASTESDYKKKPTFWDHLIWNSKVRLFYVVLLCALLGILLPSVISYFLKDYSVELGSCSSDIKERFPCLSGYSENVNSSACSKAGCCWDTQPRAKIKCFHVKPTRYTYQVTRAHNKTAIHLDPRYRDKDPFQDPLHKVIFTVKAVNRNHLIIMLYSKESGQQPPYRLLTEDQNLLLNETVFDVYYSNSSDVREFGIIVNRKDTKEETLLDMTRGPMILSENYVEFTTMVPQPILYGLGLDRHHSLKRSFDFQNISMYTRQNYSGFHPFYMAVEKSGKVHGVYWDNMHPLEVQLTPAPAVVFRSMGGSAVIHLLAGPNPEDVSRQYVMDLVGKIHLPPYWALGFHLCRQSVNESAFDVTFDAMQKASIGFDSDCIDFRLSGSTAMAIDSSNFPHAAQQRKKILSASKKFVITQNPHVSSNQTFDLDLINDDNDPFQGTVDDVQVYYPNYPDPGQETDLETQLDFDDILDPDGFYFVNNYPLNEETNNCTADTTRKFYLEALQPKGMTNTSICLDALHGQEKHMEKHNIYGVSHMNYVMDHYKRWQGKRRALVMNTATTLGNLGKAGSAGDDFAANWTSMQAGLVQVLDLGLFGIPLAGVPICGSLNSTDAFTDGSQASRDELLCLRWYQMSMFLPFAWSTNKLGHRLRSPVDWSPTAQRYIRGYIRQRYALLPYIYTLFYNASVEGYPVVRPLFYEFLSDNNTHEISDQFMLGNSIMVCPTTRPISDSLQQVYFPNATWFDFYTGDVVKSGAGNATVSSPDGHINVFVREATMFVEQDASDSAESSRASTYTVTAAFPPEGEFTINGHLYVDDGITPDTVDYDLIEFTFNRTNINIVVKDNNLDTLDAISRTVDVIRIFGVNQEPAQVEQNGSGRAFTYNPQHNVLIIEQVNFNWKSSNQTNLNIIY